MEKRTKRMDGLSEKLAKDLLKLIGIIIEGKADCKHLLELNKFLENIKERILFYAHMRTNFPNLLEKYGLLFSVLWKEVTGCYPHDRATIDIDSILVDLHNKFEKIRVDYFKKVAVFDRQPYAAILVLEDYKYQWKPENWSIEETLKRLNFPKDALLEDVIYLYIDKYNKTLHLLFYEYNALVENVL